MLETAPFTVLSGALKINEVNWRIGPRKPAIWWLFYLIAALPLRYLKVHPAIRDVAEVVSRK